MTDRNLVGVTWTCVCTCLIECVAASATEGRARGSRKTPGGVTIAVITYALRLQSLEGAVFLLRCTGQRELEAESQRAAAAVAAAAQAERVRLLVFWGIHSVDKDPNLAPLLRSQPHGMLHALVT